MPSEPPPVCPECLDAGVSGGCFCFDAGRQHERAALAAWLDREAAGWRPGDMASGSRLLYKLALKIRRGDHLK
jgi:hypothetical protein